MTDASDPIVRRVEALERATEKRLDDARDVHRREHEAWDAAHTTYHERYEQGHQALHDKAEENAEDVRRLYDQRFAVEERHRDEARMGMDRRLEGMNEIRAQLNQQAGTFVTIAAFTEFAKAVDSRFVEFAKGVDSRFDQLGKQMEQRYEDNRKRIEQLEKGDVKAEGRSLGQGATIAIIVGVVSFVGTVLGIVILLANLTTGAP